LNKVKIKAFTLVELIVVITILTILSTIAFLSLQWYSQNARDTARISDMKNIEKWLEFLLTQWKVIPLPDNKINIIADGKIIWYQWYAWKKVLDKIKIFWWAKDPKSDQYYTYMTNTKLNKYEILWYLEWKTELSLIQNMYALDLHERYPKVVWKKLWILLDSWSLKSVQDDLLDIDIVSTNRQLKAYIDDKNIISWTGNVISTSFSLSLEIPKLDNNLLWYWNSNKISLNKLSDLSENWNYWVCKKNNVDWICKFWDNFIFSWDESIWVWNLINENEWTISLWYKPSRLFNYNTIWDNSIDDNKWEMWIYTNWQLKVRANSNAWNFDWSINTNVWYMKINKWYNIVYTWKNNYKSNLYINWNLIWSKWYTSTNAANVTFWWSVNTKWEWLINKMRIYKRALDYNEIKYIYNSNN
jgi:prepilin-type N-terminal cleavage/methylation domain-containing protein